ncbi:hypothetical protein QZH41_014518 [Actinostola sp. cb2023]|nr:hypothetical protein QZH41_014518 [Actinostola sp. cb2023]
MDESINIIEDDDDDDDDEIIIIHNPRPKPPVPVQVVLCDSDDDDDHDDDDESKKTKDPQNNAVQRLQLNCINQTNVDCVDLRSSDDSDLNCIRVNDALMNDKNKQRSKWYDKYKTRGTTSRPLANSSYTCPERKRDPLLILTDDDSDEQNLPEKRLKG